MFTKDTISNEILALFLAALFCGCGDGGDSSENDTQSAADIVDVGVADVMPDAGSEDTSPSDISENPDVSDVGTGGDDVVPGVDILDGVGDVESTSDIVTTVECPEDMIPDCQETCVLAAWLGDSFCDAAFDCAQLNYDEADCPASVVDVEKGETTWLSWDDDLIAGAHQYQDEPAHYYEYIRFHMEQPVRIWALQARFSVPAPETVTVYLWDDFGGNFMNFDVAKPLSKVTVDLTPDQSGEWVILDLPMPVELDPGRLFYAGIIVDGLDHVQLLVDVGPTEVPDAGLTSFVWLSEEPPDSGGFPTYSSAAGDYMLRAEVEYIHVVEEHDFEPILAEEIGLGGFSRIAMADVDGDGDVDAMVNGPALWLNDGNGFFSNAGGWLPGGGGNGGVFGDFDNDGDPDYFLTGGEDKLWRNDGDGFVDVTAESGIDDTQLFTCNGVKGEQHVPTETAAWFDANGDGWLDLYTGNFICWEDGLGSQDQLWINNGDGTFTDGTVSMNLVEGQMKVAGKPKYYSLASRGSAPADYNNDGQMDLFVANYRLHRNLMWENQGGASFLNAGETSGLEGVGVAYGFELYFGHTIGAAWGDVDEDGDLDVFHANLAHPRFYSFSDLATLFINGGGASPVFEDVGEEIGLRYQETPSNPNLWDYDNDGDLDLFYTCTYGGRPSQFYRNDGHPLWKEVNYPTGLIVKNGWGSVVADIDGDGDLDLLASSNHFRNKNLSGQGAIFIRPKGMGAGMTNRSGFGARVLVELEGKTIMRELGGSHGTTVQDSPFVHVGIGAASSAETSVYFPLTGVTIELGQVEAGSRLVVEEDGTIIEY